MRTSYITVEPSPPARAPRLDGVMAMRASPMPPSEGDQLVCAAPDLQPGYAGGKPGKRGGGKPATGSPEWDSPAYDLLRQEGLMRSDWRVRTAGDLQLRRGNTTPNANFWRNTMAMLGFPCCGPCIKGCCFNMAEIPAGRVQCMEDGRGGFEFLGQGVHFYFDQFIRLQGEQHALASTQIAGAGIVIRNGDRTIVEVEQGFVGMAMDMGQPILLPPGMHQWQSDTMVFQQHIDLHQPVIMMGPYTLLTVDKGYDAVTQNNGEQQVLEGGSVHLLNHRNWKFEKFITRKIQTDDLQQIEAITGDNVLMHVGATVCWHIYDSQLCAEKGAETMVQHNARGVNQGQLGDISKLRNDVLKQAEASLSAFIGKVNFSDTFSAATAVQTGVPPDRVNVSGIPAAVVEGEACAAAPLPGQGVPALARPVAQSTPHRDEGSILFDLDKLKDAVTHANDMTLCYGVKVLSINIISARPADTHLMNALAKGAVAAAEAQQFETTAKGRARAVKIEAQGEAQANVIAAQGQSDSLKISAQADASAEVTRAEGSLEAANKLRQSDVAVALATIGAQGKALEGAKSSLILGNDPRGMGNILIAPHDAVGGR